MSDETKGPEGEDPEFPGTLFVVMLIVILTAGLWVAVYLMLLNR
ncbi:MAG TPA: cytochrome c oxidase subunit 2A [Gemmatimonadota bacterium]|nr:cytochrome c oxidase subunit 2A [Gemmatimonadota bacterium]